MLKRAAGVVCMAVYLIAFIITGLSFADSAEVLPEGVSRVSVTTNFWMDIDERYDPDGNKEDLATNFNLTLDGSVFSDLALVEDSFGMTAGTATVGDSIVTFEYEFKDIVLEYQYGLTDRLTVGIVIPYWYQKNKVTRRLDATNATVGKSTVGLGFGAPLAPLSDPLAFGDVEKLTTEDILHLLGNGLDVNSDGTIDIEGFDFKELNTWSDSGLSDIEAGARYQYFNNDVWRLAFTGGVRFPTGAVDDPDSLVDVAFGDGAYALLFRFNNDYMGIKDMVINTTLRYDLVLPAKEELRVPADVDSLITTDKEKVDRDIGDTIELEASGSYELYKGLNMSLLYQYAQKYEDRVSGDQDFAYKSLEEETDYTSHIYIVSLSYSTLPLFMDKKFPVPLEASISYRDRFAGTNNALDSQYIATSLSAYF